MSSSDGDTMVVRVRGGSGRVATRSGVWRVRRKHLKKIQKRYVIDVPVELFWAFQKQ